MTDFDFGIISDSDLSDTQESESESEELVITGKSAGYRFHPVVNSRERLDLPVVILDSDDDSSGSETTSESDNDNTMHPGEGREAEVRGLTPRLASIIWCSCGKCDVSTLSLEKECLCCHEIPETAGLRFTPDDTQGLY